MRMAVKLSMMRPDDFERRIRQDLDAFVDTCLLGGDIGPAAHAVPVNDHVVKRSALNVSGYVRRRELRRGIAEMWDNHRYWST